jgi:hypothetical protein
VKIDFDTLQEMFDSISENVSEKKRGRGRPAKFAHECYEPLEQFSAQTQRGKQNFIYASLAVGFLTQNEERFAYLLKPVFRATILAELGRINNPNVMASAADEICRARLKTFKAVALCRRMRGASKPSPAGLAAEIRRAIQKYRDRHPNVSEADVTAALRIVSYK